MLQNVLWFHVFAQPDWCQVHLSRGEGAGERHLQWCQRLRYLNSNIDFEYITMSSFLKRHDVFSEHTGDNCILCVLLSHISSITLLNITWLCTWRCSKWYKLCRCEGELCRPPCENGGRCLANEKGDWRCYCWPDFSGERCEVNHCTDYCLNGGTCMGSPLGTSVLSKTLYCMIPLDDSHVWRVSESLHEE